MTLKLHYLHEHIQNYLHLKSKGFYLSQISLLHRNSCCYYWLSHSQYYISVSFIFHYYFLSYYYFIACNLMINMQYQMVLLFQVQVLLKNKHLLYYQENQISNFHHLKTTATQEKYISYQNYQVSIQILIKQINQRKKVCKFHLLI
ncbi:transmembrane protein, putative (macronuclear) [Tetrahymena thermophila SB210]|uniref:Transmembrane protein, putative n=1 Tax=Tetrahymena thermophila (strain SB210) TaxID=312017 RepID=W7X8R2_TETTS|nr:transmembrane protein, putative [Tetrahymena thermophila SB210]EWS75765.1 transmembrane protein, putative [Tetrahymena thermophila SB210]|eukprot:XP_012651687.1 transmembrane protein, putative [Tetrahymena thermophila SB210]